MGQTWRDGYSAEVELFLEVGGERFRLEQVGPESFILRDPCEFPEETEASIIVKIDGKETKYHAFLHNGVILNAREVQYL